MFETSEERRIREMREIEMMMEQARFKAALQKLNEQSTGQSATAAAVGVGAAGGVGGSSEASPDQNKYVANGYIDNYFQ